MADPDAIAQAVAAAMGPVVAQLQQIQGQAQHPAAPPVAVPFARAPALVSPDVLDYSTATGAKIYKAAIAPLTTTFSLKSPDIRVLIEELTLRSNQSGWDSLLQVNIAPTGQVPQVPINRSLLKRHGEISYARVQAQALTFIDANNRLSQNDFQLLNCLIDSVDEHTKRVMANKSDLFTIGTGPTKCGILYLKVLLSQAEVDSRALAGHVRSNLAQLNVYMVQVAKNDVAQFNTLLVM